MFARPLLPPCCRASLLLQSGLQAPCVTVQTSLCHWCDSSSFKHNTRKKMLLESAVLHLSLGQGDSFLTRTEQGGGGRSRSSEEDEGGRKAVCCLLWVQPCWLLSHLLTQEMEKFGIQMREPGEPREAVK